jgi:hypothetical protein
MEEILKHFAKVGLEEFGDGRFGERKDRKFPCHVNDISQVVKGLENDYDLITPAEKAISKIDTHYFDTPSFDFFRAHHRGKSRRLKVRFRKYPDTQTSFLEIKKKSTKGVTFKDRVESPFEKTELNRELGSFLTENGVADYEDLHKVLEVKYRRYSFVSKDRAERFSIDFEVEFNHDGQRGTFGDLAIFEVKQERIQMTPIVKKLRENQIREKSLSKYCLSLSSLKPELKSNRFKPALRNLQALFHAKTQPSTT